MAKNEMKGEAFEKMMDALMDSGLAVIFGGNEIPPDKVKARCGCGFELIMLSESDLSDALAHAAICTDAKTLAEKIVKMQVTKLAKQ
jgi:hypothetical protein